MRLDFRIRGQFLLKIVNHYFKVNVSSDRFVGAFSGIRPLIENEGDQASRVNQSTRLQRPN